MRKTFVAAATVAIFALLVTPAFAAPGGNGGGKGKPGSGSELPATSSIAFEEYSHFSLGSEVGFSTTAVGLASWEWPMVTIWCYQDLNGDGIHTFPNDGGDLVYAQMDHPDV